MSHKMEATELSKIAEGMKKKATEYPFDMGKILLQGMNPAKTIEMYQTQFEFDSYDLRVTLTLDILDKRRGWHVSIGSNGSGLNIPDRICQSLFPYFLPMKRKPFEVPSVHGKSVRQFIELID